MTMQEIIENGIRRSIENFKSQYGETKYNDLKDEVLKSLYVKDLYNSINIIDLPTAETFMNTCTKIDYINVETFFIDYSPKDYEKKLDYLYYSVIIVIDNFIRKIAPIKLFSLKNFDDKQLFIIDQGLYYKINSILGRLSNIYDELEKQYKK